MRNGDAMSNTKVRLALLSASLLAIGAVGCGSSNSGSGSGGGGGIYGEETATDAPVQSGVSAVAPPPLAGVTISGFSFSEATVAAGAEFTISNNDGPTHTFTDDGGSFDVSIDGGATAKLTIATAGTYKVHCNIHGSMHGTITVTG